ncbi:MAG: hypothetical protein ACRD2E_10855 [Terriglobales bacterium]
MTPESFEDLLAQALAADRPAPPDGLAPRLVAVVTAAAASAETAPPRRRPRSIPLGAAAAAIAVALALWAWPPSPTLPPPAAVPAPAVAYARALLRAHRQAPQPRALRPAVTRPGIHRLRLAQLARPEHHWPAVFPSPAPPTPEERALVEFIRTAPPKVVAAAFTFPKLAPEPGQASSPPIARLRRFDHQKTR